MTFVTHFNIGDRVIAKDTKVAFVIGQIRIQTLTLGNGKALVLTEYRANWSAGRNSSWRHEGCLKLVEAA